MSISRNSHLRHVSIRVPWHDSGWSGKICENPRLNSACLKLDNIARNRNDELEAELAGRSVKDLPQNQMPCCAEERSTFMADFELIRQVTHPYTKTAAKTHQHFATTPFRQAPYSAPCIPFLWLRKENLEVYGQKYNLDVNPEWEPELPFQQGWVQDYRNHHALLDGFWKPIKPEESLCFFYAKQVPLIEDHGRRILIGVGRVRNVGSNVEYQYQDPPAGSIRSLVWERAVQHSIRPNFKDGFILPYHAALELAQKNTDFDPAEIVAFAPDDRRSEFSYATEHVTHDGAIASLLACAKSLRQASKNNIEGSWEHCLRWIDLRLAELWKMRGPCPGLGSVLSAFGIELGTFVARDIAEQLSNNDDPWIKVDAVFQNPQGHLSPQLASQISRTLQRAWQALTPERKALIQLLSRFEITPEEAKILWVEEERSKAGVKFRDQQIIENPYLIYELTRLTANPISIWTVDRGVFPDSYIQENHPLPSPSALDGGLDERRVRALTVEILEQAAANGDTLQSQSQVIKKIRDLELKPGCEITQDTIRVVENYFPGTIEITEIDNSKNEGTSADRAYQLSRLAQIRELIRKTVIKRINGQRHSLNVNWHLLLDKELEKSNPNDEAEEQARKEKAKALEELANSRFSVLIGPAGTGKTTLLSILCKESSIANAGILLLAPTGKARVRMEQASRNLQLEAYTLAQFLSRCERYDGRTQRYHLSDKPRQTSAKTVIVDEASMLTEEMLAALLDALKGVNRLILVGDPQQLPPIGAGRPFVDIVAELTPTNVESHFPRIGNGYAELTIRRRQAGTEREDLQLASWFSGKSLEPGEDEIFGTLVNTGSSSHIKFIRWDTPEEFKDKLINTLVEELALKDVNDIQGFDQSLGAIVSGEYTYFNLGAAKQAENWQLLSPVRGLTHGVEQINRIIHRTFKVKTVNFARQVYRRKIPKPFGREEIVYGDKVINVTNHRRGGRKVYPKDNAIEYIANGEIGVVIGQFRTQRMKTAPWLLKVEFSSQQGFQYDFKEEDFGEESNPLLELAYCLTIHKAQGSEFNKVIFVLPNPCRLLSRELLYTALTRQKQRVIILHQGESNQLKQYTSDARSDTACRLTNLFDTPQLVEVFFSSYTNQSNVAKQESRFLENRLIHYTLKKEAVRSKSEVIIANLLAEHNIEYSYEKPLQIDGQVRSPDFTIEDDDSGITYYWEHCGLLNDPSYKKRWEAKKNWYRNNGILPYEEGCGENGVLIETNDLEGIDSSQINNLIKELFF